MNFKFLFYKSLKLYKTYNVKVSLNFGDQIDCLALVTNLRFLSDKWGPIKLTSTNGLKPPLFLGHFKSFATTTEIKSNQKLVFSR